jgi:hypothetical protein
MKTNYKNCVSDSKKSKKKKTEEETEIEIKKSFSDSEKSSKINSSNEPLPKCPNKKSDNVQVKVELNLRRN